ncbi:glutaminyl-tRNA synthetase, partial [Pasteurella multocida subsp. multocida str. Anand1_cattle]
MSHPVENVVAAENTEKRPTNFIRQIID